MKVVKNRFDQLIRGKGISPPGVRQLPIGLEAFDKLASWAIEQGIFDKQLFYSKVSEWVRKGRLPKVSFRRPSPPRKKYKDIEDIIRDLQEVEQEKSEKVGLLKLTEDAYQTVMRWAVQQGATNREEMAKLFEKAVLKATLPGQRKRKKNRICKKNEAIEEGGREEAAGASG